jgi:hypothetical protein
MIILINMCVGSIVKWGEWASGVEGMSQTWDGACRRAELLPCVERTIGFIQSVYALTQRTNSVRTIRSHHNLGNNTKNETSAIHFLNEARRR